MYCLCEEECVDLRQSHGIPWIGRAWRVAACDALC